ncbi:MAG: CARDB domain-containing protein, partial [Thermodesulfobacteriota bacterium]
MSGDITVSAGKKLTVKPGTVVKFAQFKGILVDGELDARGSFGSEIYFTDFRDDTVGGDANKDGNTTSPAPGWWWAIWVRGVGSATLEWCQIAYAGYWDSVGIYKTGTGNLLMRGVIIRNVSGDGLRIDGSTGDHEIIKSSFISNTNGVLVRNQSGTIVLSGSFIEDNTNSGLINQGIIDVDARSSWWGHASGPKHPTKNPSGLGDRVSDGVLFEPWRQTEADNEILSPIRSGTLVKGDTLRFMGVGTGESNVTYLWDFGSGRTSTLLNPGLVGFPSVGEFEVTFVTVKNGQTEAYPDTRRYKVFDSAGTFADLEVTQVTAPASLMVGQSAEISYSVRNIGTKAIQGVSWSDALYLSKDAYLDITDSLLTRVSVTQDLPIGGSYQGSINFTFPAVEEGPYYLILSVDDDWQIVELRQLNNEYAVQATGLVPLLQEGVSKSVTFSERFLSHYYRVEVPEAKNIEIPFSSTVAGFEVYARFGSLPSRGVYDYRLETGKNELLIPSAASGSWYILIYGEALPQSGQYTIKYSTADLTLLSVSPNKYGTGMKMDLTLKGAGFITPLQVTLFKSGGGVYNAESVAVDSYTSAVANFSAGSVPAGVYDVRVSRQDGATDTLPSALEIIAGGKPKFETRLILPERFGYHQLATVFVEYANSGDAPMAAPLLLIQPTQKRKPGAILTLDKTRLSEGFWTSVMPEGFTNEVQFLASGETPGLLMPGESRRVPIYYAGWLKPWDFSYPPFDWGIGVLSADDTTPVNWASMKDGMRPSNMSAEVWDILWSNFTSQAGSTWGDYVKRLSENALYLNRLGQRVEAIDKLLSFSLIRADSLNPVHVLAASVDAAAEGPGLSISFERIYTQPISRRYALGPLGRGWTHSWQISLNKETDGTVVVTDMTGAIRIFQPDSRYSGHYIAQPGDQGALSDVVGGGFTLREADGMTLRFFSNGKLQYIEDTN